MFVQHKTVLYCDSWRFNNWTMFLAGCFQSFTRGNICSLHLISLHLSEGKTDADTLLICEKQKLEGTEW